MTITTTTTSLAAWNGSLRMAILSAIKDDNTVVGTDHATEDHIMACVSDLPGSYCDAVQSLLDDGSLIETTHNDEDSLTIAEPEVCCYCDEVKELDSDGCCTDCAGPDFPLY